MALFYITSILKIERDILKVTLFLLSRRSVFMRIFSMFVAIIISAFLAVGIAEYYHQPYNWYLVFLMVLTGFFIHKTKFKNASPLWRTRIFYVY